jgi:hypothetical protein
LVFENGHFAALDGNRLLPHGETHERFPRHLLRLPRDYELAIRWLGRLFSTEMIRTPGRQARAIFRERAILRDAPLATGWRRKVARVMKPD